MRVYSWVHRPRHRTTLLLGVLGIYGTRPLGPNLTVTAPGPHLTLGVDGLKGVSTLGLRTYDHLTKRPYLNRQVRS